MIETTVNYIVRRRFKYGKIHYKPGDVFIPAGGKFDEQILRSNLVALDVSKYRHASRVSLRQKRAPKIGQKAAEQFELDTQADDVTAEVLASLGEPKAEVPAANKRARHGKKAGE